MTVPQIEFKYNIISVANFVALIGLLATAMTTYSSLVSNWTAIEKDRALFKQQIVELQKVDQNIHIKIADLVAKDGELRLALANLQATLASRLAVLEVELRQLNTTVTKIEGAVQSGAVSNSRRGR